MSWMSRMSWICGFEEVKRIGRFWVFVGSKQFGWERSEEDAAVCRG